MPLAVPPRPLPRPPPPCAGAPRGAPRHRRACRRHGRPARRARPARVDAVARADGLDAGVDVRQQAPSLLRIRVELPDGRGRARRRADLPAHLLESASAPVGRAHQGDSKARHARRGVLQSDDALRSRDPRHREPAAAHVRHQGFLQHHGRPGQQSYTSSVDRSHADADHVARPWLFEPGPSDLQLCLLLALPVCCAGFHCLA
mmetsp:Transcript_32291/g.106570  ORF Transcript_32291/g.106570 Transcript_32291/m.106570 type:complete len:203 (-) Transcript_32291:1568-2176(-)